ncbi:ABC-F type ribosomal protection protein [Enterococcus faecium]|nr:ABC-F type ribosomal protection protein [Enterococcus faecium]EGV5850274.1 ABC-F type ribosomal protection protein [Enterococcus faecium]
MENLAVNITNLQVSFGNQLELSIDSLRVYQQDRIGIIGENGVGKSTLLKLIAGELFPDHGKIQTEITFNYLPQLTYLAEAKDLNLELASHFQLRLEETSERKWSGGEERKIELIRLLSSYEQGMLLDEPTTHLDRKSIDRLIEELRYYYGTLVFVSHDRYFLDELASKIWEVKDGEIREFSGNYSAYLTQKELEKKTQLREAESIMKEKKRLEKSIQEKKKQAEKLEKSIQEKKKQAEKLEKVSSKKKKQQIRPDRLSSSKQKDSVQKAIQKNAKTLERRLQKIGETTKPQQMKQIRFPVPKSLELHSRYPIMGQNVQLERSGRTLLVNGDFQFSLGKKIAIVGENGSGKTTLLEHIRKQGEGILLSPKVSFQVYQQKGYQMTSEESIIRFVMRQTEFSESLVRSLLNHLGFAQETLTKPLCTLSGGEATRLTIALLFTKPSNVLLLDEPTNFIDMATIEALEKLMQIYPGTILFTSHDSYFVERTADEVYEIKGQKIKKVLTRNF